MNNDALIKKYLWSLDKSVLDLKKDFKPIITNILNFGDMEALSWLFKQYDTKTIASVASSPRSGISDKSKNFFAVITA